MQEHWHNIYVIETISEVVGLLRANGLTVRYNPKSEDPEGANAYIEPDSNNIVSSFVRWRSRPASKLAAIVPKEAMACIQLLSTDPNFMRLRAAIERVFRIVQDCQNCPG